MPAAFPCFSRNLEADRDGHGDMTGPPTFSRYLEDAGDSLTDTGAGRILGLEDCVIR
jgi:hypothetical protein